MKRASIASSSLHPSIVATLGTGSTGVNVGAVAGFVGRSPPRRSLKLGEDEEGIGDAVLVKCRDTIEKLQEELEEERSRRRELQRHVNSVEAETLQLQNEVDLERGKRAEYEARVAQLEKKLSDAEAKLDTSGKWRETANLELQKAKADAVQRAEELFSEERKVQELEHALQRAESRIASAEAEIRNFNSELGINAQRLADAEFNAAQMRIKLQEEKDNLEQLKRHADDKEQAMNAARKEVDDATRALRSLEEEQQQHVIRLKLREESLLKQYKEKEAELKQNLGEKVERAKQEASQLTKEVEVLKTKIPELESASNRETEAVNELKAEWSQAQAEIKRLESDQARMVQEMNLQSIALAQVKAQCDIYARQAQALEEEKRQTQDGLFDLRTENEQLHREVDEAKKLLGARNDDLHRMQELHEERKHQMELIAKRETASLKEQAEGELRKVSMELAGLRMQQKLDNERRTELVERQQRALESKDETQKQLSELSSQLDKSSSELQVEREKTKECATSVVHMRRALQQSEDEVDDLQVQLRAAQRELASLQQQAEARVAAAMAERDARSQELERQMSRCAAKIKEVQLGAEKISERSQDKMRKKYEKKLSKMHQQLAERETYESRLKSLIEDEVSAIQQWNTDLSGHSHRRAASAGNSGRRKVVRGLRGSDVGKFGSDIWQDDSLLERSKRGFLDDDLLP